MKRIDTTVDNLFHDPDAGTGELGTIVPAESLNNFQEELSKAIETELELDPADDGQLAKVLGKIKADARRMAHYFGRG